MPKKIEEPEVKDFTEIGGSPVPGLTLRNILRGHTASATRFAWSPDGKYLATPFQDNTIRIWDIKTGICVHILKGHSFIVNCVTWSPNGDLLTTGDSNGDIILWDVITGKIWKRIRTSVTLLALIWSPDGSFLASTSQEGRVHIFYGDGKLFYELKHKTYIPSANWSPKTKTLAYGLGNPDGALYLFDLESKYSVVLSENASSVDEVVWSKNGKALISGHGDKLIRIWNPINNKLVLRMEGHLGEVNGLGLLDEKGLLISSSLSGDIIVWDLISSQQILTFNIGDGGNKSISRGKLALNPRNSLLAIRENDVIYLYNLDTNIILHYSKPKSINYTTAKLVLVGDSGVGKTGLGWRLAHGEFREHASSHGQQFWSIPQLGLKREDGTDCEAVLWDLAGQPVYRQIHSIFLENITAALVLFDANNRQDPLKGVLFWLEQLKGKGQLPPTVLIGGRVDVSPPALSLEEYKQFCQRYGITGGYISTSAMKGDGLDELMEILKKQVPWDEMTAIVTTATFKKIKDYVLSLKEKPDRKGVLVNPQELRKQLEATDKNWQFSDAEMMTAIGHLETHGYISVLHNSGGEQFVLLTPDVLVNLAASIMLLADKNVRELGAVSETELLQGKFTFDELKGLEKGEQQILIDSAILRFLEHSICFRETLNDDILLIFPSLIKQKRPLQDDIPSADDISYVVHGRVENIYASLVVLLGYTPSFTRINQWQNQAQYEMKEGELCGFRSIEEREGEIELVLYYGEKMPQSGRDKYQELFEQFLYQREVEITRFPPVVCKNGHQQKRSTVVERAKEGKTFVFCDECGDKVALPDFEKTQTIGIGASPWLQREEAMARLRSLYEKHLTNIKSYRRGWASPRVFISRLPEQNHWAEKLIHDLRDAGVFIVEKPEDFKAEDFAIILDTAAYQKAFRSSSPILTNDTKVIRSKLSGDKKKLFSLACEGSMSEHNLNQCTPGNFCDETHYSVSLFNLLLELYAIPLNYKGFEPLRKSLHEQWEQSLSRLSVLPEPLPPKKRFDIALSFPGEYRKQVEAVANKLAEKLGQESIFYDKYHEAELARPNLDTHLQSIYHDDSELIVVFLCAEYEKKEWCGLEWRALRDLIKKKETAIIMPMRFDQTEIPGLFSIDGYIDIAKRNADEVSQLILQRLERNQKS